MYDDGVDHWKILGPENIKSIPADNSPAVPRDSDNAWSVNRSSAGAVVQARYDGLAVAWIPVVFRHIIISHNGLACMGVADEHIYLFRREGYDVLQAMPTAPSQKRGEKQHLSIAHRWMKALVKKMGLNVVKPDG